MSDETTTEQLAEIEWQAESTPATEYTPPDGWRLLAVGELVMLDDQWVRQDGSVWRSMGTEGPVSEGARYIRRIEPEPVWVCEGRWRTRNGEIKNIRACEPLKGAYYVWPWTDGFMTFQDNGRHQGSQESAHDLVEYLGPIEPQAETELQQPQPQPEPQPQQNGLVRDVTHLLQESGVLDSAKFEQQIEELRSEVSYVQNLLGESRQRVTQLEELVASLRTINEAQEKAFTAAGKENTALRQQVENRQQEYDRQKVRIEFLETLNAGYSATFGEYKAKIERLQGLVDFARKQLEAAATEHDSLSTQLAEVKAELATQGETSRRLQIELDAAQQVPQAIADRFEEGWDAGTARAVETIAEWLQPFRGCNSSALVLLLLEALPSIMRHLTGLTPED